MVKINPWAGRILQARPAPEDYSPGVFRALAMASMRGCRQCVAVAPFARREYRQWVAPTGRCASPPDAGAGSVAIAPFARRGYRQ